MSVAIDPRFTPYKSVNVYNPYLNGDSYKFSHFLQLPKDAKRIKGYYAPRSSKSIQTDRVVWYGTQMEIMETLMRKRTKEDLEFAAFFMECHGLPFNKEGFALMNKRYGDTAWPISIKALPEGTASPIGVAQCTIENTDDDFPWLSIFLETNNLRGAWYDSTTATVSKLVVDYVRSRLIQTSGSDAGYTFKVHDFGGRAATCLEHLGRGASAHLINSQGTDSVTGMLYALRYYNADLRTLGFSIPAAEHATACAYGLTDEGETEFFKLMVDTFGRKGSYFAVVSDARDIYNAVDVLWGDVLRESVEKCGGTLVIRPDSGKPEVVLPELLGMAASKFGFRYNSRGYKVLPDCVRFIWGDGINLDSIKTICDALVNADWSIENVAFGMGGALINAAERDTFGYAQKACWLEGEGYTRDLYKDPITDPGKKSLRGNVTTWVNDDTGEMVSAVERPGAGWREALIEVYRNGDLLVEENFQTIRDRANSYRFF